MFFRVRLRDMMESDKQSFVDDFSSEENASIYWKNYLDLTEIAAGSMLNSLRKFHSENFMSEELGLGTLVDVGCASGQQTQALSKYFDRVFAFDISKDQIAKAKAEIDNPNIIFGVGTAENIPVEDDIVDVISSVLAFHFMDMDKFVEEVRRVLKPGGIAILTGYIMMNMELADRVQLADTKRKEIAMELVQKCLSQNLEQAEAINHPERHLLKYGKEVYESIQGIKKKYDIGSFDFVTTAKKYKDHIFTVPFYGATAHAGPHEELFRELKSLWNREDTSDEDLNIRITYKSFSILLMNEKE